MSFWRFRKSAIGNHFHLPGQILTEGGAPSTNIRLTKDLATHPNTEDGAIVVQPGLSIVGPAWVRCDTLVEDFTQPVGANTTSIVIWLLDEDWTSGETNALSLYGFAADGSHTTTGGLASGGVGSSRLYVKEGVTARVGLVVQPLDNGNNPVAGQPTGTLRVFITVGVA